MGEVLIIGILSGIWAQLIFIGIRIDKIGQNNEK